MIADDLSRIAMSSGLAASLTRATEHARARGHIDVSLEHILLALCDDPEAVLVLAASNVNVDELIGEVDGQLAAIPPHPDGQHAELVVSDDLRRILEAAAAAARGGRRREINGAIVLAAIVGDGKSPAAQVLGAQGMTFEGAIRALQARVSSPPAPQPAPTAADAESILANARERVQSRTVAPSPTPAPIEAPVAAPPPVAAGVQQLDEEPDHSDFADEDSAFDYAPEPAGYHADGRAENEAASYRSELDHQHDADESDGQFDAEANHGAFDDGFEEPVRHQPSTAPPTAPAHQVTRPDLAPPPPDFSGYSDEPPPTPTPREQQAPVWASWPASEPEFTQDPSASRPPPRQPEPMEDELPPQQRHRPPMPSQPAPSFPDARGVSAHGGHGDGYAIDAGPSLRRGRPAGDDYPQYDGIEAEHAAPYDDFGSRREPELEGHSADSAFVEAHDYDDAPMPASAPFPPPVRPPSPSHASAHDGWAPPPVAPARSAAVSPPPPIGGSRSPAPRPPMPPVPSAALPPDPAAGPQAYLRRSLDGPGPSPSSVRPGPPPLAPWPEPEARGPAPMPVPVPPGRGEVTPFDKRQMRGGGGAAAPVEASPMARAPRPGVGKLVENIPRVMRVSIPALIEVRIARSDVQRLAEGLQGSGAVYQHDVTITKAMSVRLRAPDGGFFIETASPETQWIEKAMLMSADDFASWRWHVTPRETGRKRLQLIISARTVGADGLAAETALPDQVITVRVRTNYAQTATRWAGWGAAAIVGGLLAKFGEGVVSVLGSLIG